MIQSYISARNGIPSSLEDGEAVSSCLIEVDIRKKKLIILRKESELGFYLHFRYVNL